ncbi:family 16 glycoside hydrolase [Streptomyces flavalbus]|uniref:Family 16 glycoside hydrolase n=1 Tax=Streptomyces flavalbus TaxID=2665155 RepID=A0ABW2WJN3_9ACTN
MNTARVRRSGWLLALVLAPAALVPACAAGPAERGRPAERTAPGTRWPEGSTHGPWHVTYDGGGAVTERDGTLVLAPRPARHADETHAALVTSVEGYGDLTYRLRMRTARRLREPEPNPWEAAWAVWHYTDDTHFYYLVLKPNGWELGKADPACPGNQCFLATHHGSYPVDDWHDVEVRQTGATMTVRVDGEPLVTHTDRTRPYPRGTVGLYTEDAVAEFRDISVRRRDGT